MDSFVAVCTLLLIVQHLPPGECTTWLCDFETSDLCGHTQDTTDDLDWTRHAGGTPTPNTGPSVDHTLGTGHYMYLETSTGSPGEVARLVSSPFPASSSPYCLRFYYHMFGSSIATLNVYIRKQGILGAPVWTLSGNQGNAWTLGRAQLDGSSSFNVIFEAVRGNGFRGDIAIDDVTVSNECEPIVTTVLPTTTPYPLASPSCTFEQSSICGYRQDIHDSADWTWHQGHTGTSDTGPGFDQTLGTATGHYMYFEASSIDPGVTARLLSPTLPIIPSSSSHTSYCVTFWYHMYGLHIGTLNVNRKESGGSEAPIWSLSDEQGNVWRQGQLPLDGTSESTVVFEAVRGRSYRGDIAIDDVDVIQYGGQCEFIPASAMVPLPSTPSTTTQSSSTSAYPSTSATLPAAEQSSTAMSPEASSAIATVATSSTSGSIVSIPATVPSTPTITTQSRSTGSYRSTSETLPAVTTVTPSTTAIGTRLSLTTNRLTTLLTGSSTNGVKTTAARTSTSTSTEASSTITTIGTRPSSTTDRPTTSSAVKSTAAQTSTTMSTEASSTIITIRTQPSSTTDKPTTLETVSFTNGVKTTAARTSTSTSTEASSTIITILTGQSWTTGGSRPSPTTVATDSPRPDMKTERATPKSVRPTVTRSTRSSRITGIEAIAAGNHSAGQTGSTATITIIAVAVVLSLVCGAVAGVVATVCYKKKKRSRSGHAKVKYITEENKPTSDSFTGVVDGKIVFENPTFEHIYEELPNVVVNSTASREEQEALSGIPSSEAEVYTAIDDDEVCGAKASSPAPTTKSDGHISSSARAKVLLSSPGQVDQTERRHGWEADDEDYTEINDNDVFRAKSSMLHPVPTSKDVGNIASPCHQVDQRDNGRYRRNVENGHTKEYQRSTLDGESEVYMEIKDEEVCWAKPISQHPMASGMDFDHLSFSDWEAESEYLPPISDPTGQGLNLNDMASNDEDHQGLNPSAHYQSLRPDHYQSLVHSHSQNSNIHDHARNPDGYQSLRNNHYQKLNGPTCSRDPAPSDMKNFIGDAHFDDQSDSRAT